MFNSFNKGLREKYDTYDLWSLHLENYSTMKKDMNFVLHQTPSTHQKVYIKSPISTGRVSVSSGRLTWDWEFHKGSLTQPPSLIPSPDLEPSDRPDDVIRMLPLSTELTPLF